MFRQAVDLIAEIHDRILHFSKRIGFTTNDAALHFIVFGVCGLILYFIVRFLFEKVLRKNMRAISGFFTLTVVASAAAGIEMAQQITNTGNMQESDLIAGILGFVCVLLFYHLLRQILRKPGRKKR